MKKIMLLATGGTIACSDANKDRTPADFSRGLGEFAPKNCEISASSPFCLDSTNMTPEKWTELALIIRDNYDNYDAFVITHGTDTLGSAAAALSCLIQNSRKPVILTGSMIPLASENSDAPANLRQAFAFACAEGAFGVRVVFGGRIIDGRSAVKVQNNIPDAFCSANRPEAGTFSGDGTPRIEGVFKGETRFYDKLSDKVFAAKLYAGQRLCVPENAKAVLVEGFGTGGVPEYLEEDFARLHSRGVYIIIGTQTLSGGTELARYAVGSEAAKRFSLLETNAMTPEFAFMKAKWALAQSDGFEEFRRLFYEEIQP